MNVEIIENAKLSNFTTFQLGGRCHSLISCQTPEQLVQTIQKLSSDGMPFILIGSGSNLLVSDEGVNAHVVRYVSEIPCIEQNQNRIAVTGSTILDDLARFAAKNGLEGLNCCTGIPGTVGGAIAGNAGAFGQQIGDCLESVTLCNQFGEERQAAAESLDLKYRSSNIKESGDIVVSAVLLLRGGHADALLKERDKILKTRREKHPDLSQEPCAGSFFRNIEPTSKAGKRQAAGWFLDQAGGKKLRAGGAYIYPKHANIIIKGEDCTAQDVYDLSQKMAALAKKKFSLDLVPEVKRIGKFKE